MRVHHHYKDAIDILFEYIIGIGVWNSAEEVETALTVDSHVQHTLLCREKAEKCKENNMVRMKHVWGIEGLNSIQC